jgi:hypothetical protein
MTRRAEQVEDKDLSERDNFRFDFSRALGTGETVSSAVVTCEVASGTDASPSALLSGSPAVSSPNVTQLVIGGLVGVSYYIRCVATLSSGRVLASTALVNIIRLSA